MDYPEVHHRIEGSIREWKVLRVPDEKRDKLVKVLWSATDSSSDQFLLEIKRIDLLKTHFPD